MAPLQVAAAAAVAAAEAEWNEAACRTPTAAECKIPDPATCPPAPRKLRSGGGDGGGQRHISPAPDFTKEYFLPAAAELEKFFSALYSD